MKKANGILKDSSRRNFGNIFLEVIQNTISLDFRFNIIIALYYVKRSKYSEFNKDILDAPFFTTSEKGKLIYKIVKEKLPNLSKGLLKKINSCLEIRNKFAHKKAVEKNWDAIGYIFRNKKGKEELNVLKDIFDKYSKNYIEISKVSTELIGTLRAENISFDLNSVIVELWDAEEDKLSIVSIILKDSTNGRAYVFDSIKKRYKKNNYDSIIEADVRKLLSEKYPHLKNKSYKISRIVLKEPEPEYIEPY